MSTAYELDAMTKKRYPTPEAYAKDIPRLLRDLGFSEERARFLADHIVVDPAREFRVRLSHHEPQDVGKTGFHRDQGAVSAEVFALVLRPGRPLAQDLSEGDLGGAIVEPRDDEGRRSRLPARPARSQGPPATVSPFQPARRAVPQSRMRLRPHRRE